VDSINTSGQMSQMQQKPESVAEMRDPRSRRTQKLLQDALVQLMGPRSFDSITVAEIAAAANVNRATFYRHYRDKYQLAQALFSEAIDSMLRTVGPPDEPLPDADVDTPDFQAAWTSLFEHVAGNDRLYRSLLGGGDKEVFIRRIRDHVASVARERAEARIRQGQSLFAGLPGKMKRPDSDIPYIFIANLLIGNIAWWLDDGRQYSRDQVIEWTRRFLRRGFRGLLIEE
jgi:AcrR family transcriptional regulator